MISSKKIAIIKEHISNGASFIYVPSTYLKELISRGDHPLASKINKGLQAEFLAGKGIRINSQDVLDWINGDMKESDSFLMDNGNLAVESQGTSL